MSKFIITVNFIIIYFLLFINLISYIESDEYKRHVEEEVYAVEEITPVTLSEEEKPAEKGPKFEYSKDWSINDNYLLAKIAMAEAEGCDLQTKCHVIMVILNRVHDSRFPNTIEEVIFEKHGDTYQFTPVGNGRWNSVEPNEECWKAVEKVINSTHDSSEGALFFESCANDDNWHSKNLIFLYESDGIRFYKP